jgi:hypothetical protein
MKTLGRRNLKTTSIRRDNATIHRMLSVSLLGVLVFCGCNKTPPAKTSASSSPPAAPAAAPALDQPTTPAASVPAPAAPAPAPPPPPPPKVYTVPAVLHLPSGFPRGRVQKPNVGASILSAEGNADAAIQVEQTPPIAP